MSIDVRHETVTLLRLEPGDILHVKMGILDMGDGQGPWIPSEDELQQAKEAWEEIIPDGIKVVITHIGVAIDVVREKV